MLYEFTKAITVDTPDGNRAFREGDQIEPGAILPGCFDALTRQRVLVEVELDPVRMNDDSPETDPDAGETAARDKPAAARSKPKSGRRRDPVGGEVAD